MSNKDAIRNMVQALIKDDTTKAEMEFHPVFTNSMKSAAGVVQKVEEPNSKESSNNDDE